MSKKLTDISAKNLRPKAVAYEKPDGGSGLYCVVQPSGHKSWAARYRINGKPAKITFGDVSGMSLADARKAAIDARESAAKGIDPSAARQAKKIEADKAKLDTVTAICERFFELKGAKLRSIKHQQSMLRRLVYGSPLGSMPIESVKRSDIVRLLDKIEATTGERSADMVLSMLRRTFNWHALRSDSFNSPIVPGMSPYKASEHRGERMLTDDEIRAVWKATEDGAPFSAFTRFLVLVGARRAEAAGIRWTEVSPDGIWTLPASRSKNKSEIVRPLSKAAQAILAERPRIDDCPWAFTTTGIGPLNSFSEPMAKLREASGVNEKWRLHDLRRTARSLLSRAGVSHDIAERCLGHAMPTIRGIYDRHRYIDEMRHAFEALSAQIERIVNPPEGAVIPMPLRR
jgi:integrase